MNTLIDYKEQVKSLCGKSIAVISKADLHADSLALKKITDEILAKTSPSMMFYGVYNAGKSSTINAIFGKDIAEVGDIPTTCEVQTIEWNNFKIIDTPGINAKNEHTLVAQNEISKSDVVLFVIADENVEEISFYKAFVDILKKDIQTVIVINQKNANYSLKDSEEIHKLTKRIIKLIRIASQNVGINNFESRKNFHGIIPVNAEMARKSQSKSGNDAKLMYDYSNLGELITIMQRILDSSGGVKMLCPAINSTEEALKSASEKIRSKIESVSEKNYYNTRDNILRQKENLYQRLIIEGRMRISNYKDTLLSSAGVKTASTPDVSSLCTELNDVLQRGFREANVDLQNQFDLYNVNIGNTNIKKSDYTLDIPNIGSSNSNYDFLNDTDLNFANSVANSLIEAAGSAVLSVVPAPIPKVPPVVIKTVVEMLFRIIQNKKREEEERRKHEEELVQECDRRNIEIEAKINEEITRILELNRQINSEMNKLEQSYKAIVNANIEKAYSPVLKSLDEQFNQVQQATESTNAILSEIDSLLNDLNELKAAITA